MKFEAGRRNYCMNEKNVILSSPESLLSHFISDFLTSYFQSFYGKPAGHANQWMIHIP
ncbi:hypothetical protein EV199_4999 [Pseudobacter ginsenosidimutans]|uniref:Uncharacterized protein n=1 Tax=Pseudobacter ginsenosidimutans TaxID=661488 RepID=A0A4Q7ML69_9BACT|nr:hypothetical protein EV199_4999 [Pseudobacter ginsenosidimutans]